MWLRSSCDWWRHNYVINFQTFQLRWIPSDQMTEWQIFLLGRRILSQLGRFCARTCCNKRRPRKSRDVQTLLKLNRVYFVPIFMVFILPFVLINFKFLWNYQNWSTQVFGQTWTWGMCKVCFLLKVPSKDTSSPEPTQSQIKLVLGKFDFRWWKDNISDIAMSHG